MLFEDDKFELTQKYEGLSKKQLAIEKEKEYVLMLSSPQKRPKPQMEPMIHFNF